MNKNTECKVCGHVAGLHDTEYCLMPGCQCEAPPEPGQFPWNLEEGE